MINHPTRKVCSPVIIFVVAFLSVFASPFVCAQTPTTTVIALEGGPVPGGDGVFDLLRDRALNNMGEVAFFTSLSGTAGGSATDTGVFRGNGTNLILIAREGQAVPGGNGTFRTFSPGNPHVVNINASGQVLFTSELAGTTGGFVDDAGFFRGNGTTIVQIAREGQAVPEGNGTLANLPIRPYRPTLNDLGQTAFLCELAGTSGGSMDNGAIYRGDGGPLVLIARKGRPVLGGTFLALSLPFMNGNGAVAFSASISGGSTAQGAFRGDGTGLTPIAVAGQAAPNGNGVLTSALSVPDINDSGELLVNATLTGTSGGSSDGRAIYRGDGGPLVQIARVGQLAPSGNGAFTSPFGRRLNQAGQVVFSSGLSGTSGGTADNSGLFRGDGNSIVEIARKGQTVPGGDGVFSVTTLNPLPNLNNAGQVAFAEAISGGSSGTPNDAGIFFYDDAVGLRTVVRRGDPFLGSTIASFNFDNDNSVSVPADLRQALNARGEVTYSFSLADGRNGIAVWSLASPAPAQLLNISTRLRVETGDNVLIGGFIVTGTEPKKVIVRAIGPSLPVADKLADPTLELRDGSGGLLASNDNWRLGGQEAEIIATTVPPANDLESALVATLPGKCEQGYTVVVRGLGQNTGVGLVEVYELAQSGQLAARQHLDPRLRPDQR